jgi:hypothetical protein
VVTKLRRVTTITAEILDGLFVKETPIFALPRRHNLRTPGSPTFKVQRKNFDRFLRELTMVLEAQATIKTTRASRKRYRHLAEEFGAKYARAMECLYQSEHPYFLEYKYAFFNPYFFSEKDRGYFWRFVRLIQQSEHNLKPDAVAPPPNRAGNEFGKTELSDEEIKKICELHGAGKKTREIVDEFWLKKVTGEEWDVGANNGRFERRTRRIVARFCKTRRSS